MRSLRVMPTLNCCRMFHRVLSAILAPQFYGKYVQLPRPETPAEIQEREDFFPFFKNALGAIDGSHLHVIPPVEVAACYRNRKGFLSQNVLVGCAFDMTFVYVLSGWEGSAGDGAVYEDARASDLAIPAGWYYLADAGFPSSDTLLVPYRGVRYHLREWAESGARCAPQSSAFSC